MPKLPSKTLGGMLGMLRMVVVIVVLFRDVRMLELQSTGPDVNLAKFLEKLKTRLGLIQD